jgi:peroxiredoxin
LSESSESRAPAFAALLAVAVATAALGWYVVASRPSPRAPLVGRASPGFSLSALDGGTVSLGELRGKVVYVNFWATWCAPCREEAPALQRLYDELRDEGFEIVAPTIDDPESREKVDAFRTQYGLAYPILLDPDRTVYRLYGATGVPETYLIDPEGNLAEAYIGPRDFDDPRYARAIRELLPERAGRDAGGADGNR